MTQKKILYFYVIESYDSIDTNIVVTHNPPKLRKDVEISIYYIKDPDKRIKLTSEIIKDFYNQKYYYDSGHYECDFDPYIYKDVVEWLEEVYGKYLIKLIENGKILSR